MLLRCVALITNSVVKLALGEFRVQHLFGLGPWLLLLPDSGGQLVWERIWVMRL